MAEALPEIIGRFVDEAKKGSVFHTKLLTDIGGLNKRELPTPKKRRGKSMVALLMDGSGEKPQGKDAMGKDVIHERMKTTATADPLRG